MRCSNSLSLFALVGISSLFFTHFTTHAGPLTLTNLSRSGDGQIAFQLLATPGTTNTIEASQTMGYWFPLTSGVATNGWFPFNHNGSTNFRRMFYRARSGAADPAENVVFQADPNLSAMALITPENGGQCQITTPTETRFTFRAPSNSLLEPAVITMTVITNIIPAAGTNPPVAVRLEPSGLLFHGAGELEILFPSNRPPGLTLSYSFGTNGTAIHLVPDLLSSNRVVIPVTHFSGFGSGQFTPSQVATFTGTALENSTARVNQQAASRLAAERQQILSGGPPDPSAMSDAVELMNNHFDTAIKPALEAAVENCTLFKSVLPLALGHLRATEFLGGDISARQAFVDQRKCAGFDVCLSELDGQCGITPAEELIRQASSIERQAQLSSCGGASRDWSERFTNCVGQWYGLIRVTETGATNETVGNTSRSGKYDYSYTAYLANGIEDVSTPGNFVITGTLEVDAFSSEKSVYSAHTARNCPTQPGKTETTTRSLLGTGLLRQLFTVFVIGEELFAISTVSDSQSPPNLSALAMRGLEDFTTVYQHCDGSESRTTVFQDITDEGAPPLLGATLFDTGDIHYQTNSIRGTFTTSDTRNPAGSMLDVPTTVTWTVELRRRP